jgi:hypothetical protein
MENRGGCTTEVTCMEGSDEQPLGYDNVTSSLRFQSETRTVVCGDAIAWLSSYEDNGLPEGYCGFTSLPDITELIHTFKTETAEYKKWFIDAAALFMSKLSVGSFVVFLQSDVRYLSSTGDISEWIDKSYLCSAAAERTGCVLMWHKLVCRSCVAAGLRCLMYVFSCM